MAGGFADFVQIPKHICHLFSSDKFRSIKKGGDMRRSGHFKAHSGLTPEWALLFLIVNTNAAKEGV